MKTMELSARWPQCAQLVSLHMLRLSFTGWHHLGGCMEWFTQRKRNGMMRNFAKMTKLLRLRTYTQVDVG